MHAVYNHKSYLSIANFPISKPNYTFHLIYCNLNFPFHIQTYKHSPSTTSCHDLQQSWVTTEVIPWYYLNWANCFGFSCDLTYSSQHTDWCQHSCDSFSDSWHHNSFSECRGASCGSRATDSRYHSCHCLLETKTKKTEKDRNQSCIFHCWEPNITWTVSIISTYT